MMSYSRRKFLSACAKTTLLCGVAPLLVNCTAGRAANPRILLPLDYIDPVIQKILWHASLAPSGHNSQPWEVKLIEPFHWHIGIPPERRLPAVDPLGRETLISLGAFVENLTQASGAVGLDAEIKVVSSDSMNRDIVQLLLVPGPATSQESLTRMQRRRVVKKGQQSEQLRSDDIRWLESIRPGEFHYLARGSAEANRLKNGTTEAMAQQCQRDEVMRELAEWVRFGEASVQAHQDGLTTAGMEIEGLSGWFVNHFYQAEDVLKPSFRKQTVDVTARLADEGAGWLLLSSSGNTPAELIETGRQFQRLFLQLRERNIACHPMSQMLEESTGQSELASLFGTGHQVQMLLRLGYVDNYPDPVSPRRSLCWFVSG